MAICLLPLVSAAAAASTAVCGAVAPVCSDAPIAPQPCPQAQEMPASTAPAPALLPPGV